MAVILLLQGIRIANIYQLLERQLSEQINDIFTISVNKDIMNRKNIVVDSTTNEIIGIIGDDYEKGVFGGPELVLQEFLIKKNAPLMLYSLDTIFHSEIKKNNIHSTFIINRLNPKTGKILETTDIQKSGKLRGAMASEVIPIRVDGSEGVQVLLVSPYRAVFKQMMYILILSLLLLLFVGYIFFSLTNSFIKEKRLRQFQTDFSHSLIHNMATPLGTIAQINNLMTNEKFVSNTEKRNKSVEIAQKQVLNLQSLTDRILTVAKESNHS